MADYYAIQPNGDGTFEIFARDTDAKQIIYGWGGTANQVEADFYGAGDVKTAPPTKGLPGRAGEPIGHWKFDKRHAEVMLSYMKMHGNDPNYYDAAEKKRAKDLKKILDFIMES